MIALLRLNGIDVWQLAGWTMLHYLWLGMLAGLAAGALRLVLRRASANVRYVAALGCLTVLAALPVAIGAWESAAPQAMQMPANSVPAPSAEIAASAPGSAGGLADVIAPIRSMETTPSVAHELLVDANAGSNPRQSRGLMDVAAIVAAYLPWLWILGAPLTFLLLTTGVIGSERLRRSSRIIHDGPIAEACTRLVESLRIGRSVTVAVCERVVAPVLVGIVRPMILLPPAALTGWSPDEIEMVLLHELAHVRRWDNLVNLVQRLVEALLFFHPAVWLVSSWVRREREACCDAVVVGRTNRPHAYAELLLNLAAHIREPSEPGRPRPRSNAFRRGRGRPGSLVSSAMAAGPLRGRIRRILQLEEDPMLISGKSLAVVMSGLLLTTTLVVLNLPARGQAEESTTEVTKKRPVSDSDNAPTNLGFQTLGYQGFAEVPFVAGASHFLDGDTITIEKVRGTADTFKPGNIYWIKGIYKLRSHDRAMLAAYTTAKDAANGISPSLTVQSTNVDRGEGTFTLFLPMSYRGWPHVSFYPTDGGEGFGGIYFGTGDSVLENWSEVYGSDDTRSAESHAKVDRGKFPSLEDQKLADKIYRRMGLELEPIGEEDLKRVKALGYDGGLKTTHGAGGIQWSDILVGLHVWPTTRLKDVVDILNRDDLTELNPLKFYVVHRNQQYPDGSVGDEVVAGRISVNRDQPRRIAPPSSTIKPQPAVAVDANHGTVQPPTAPTSDNSALRYDGKTFDEWRTAWQTELSLEKRLEVVKALAAFGASGRGREAAEAILEVAAQLDWAFIGDNSAGRLQQACIDAFTSGEMTEGYRIPTEAWWPLVVPIYENSPEKSTIVKYLANQLPAGETSLIPKLIELSNQSEATRSLALIGLKAVDPSLADDRVVARLRQSLTEADASPEQLRWAIHNLLFSPSGNYSGGMGQDLQLRMVPELQPLLFHPDLEVRQSARFVITKAQPKDAVALVERLKQIIDTQGSGRERQEAIRALAALGQRAMPAEDSLQTIAIDPKDPARIAAGAALLAMWPDIVNWSSADKLNKLFGPGAIERGDWGDVMRKLQAEQQEIYGRYQQTSVGGGGGFF